MIPKYPRTPYWPWSPTKGKLEFDPGPLVGREIVITEKLDGGNTLLYNGEVYARSTSGPARDKWFAMVRKHHAWKTSGAYALLYGEDIYGVHSIAYDPVPEQRTFYAFAVRTYNRFWNHDAVGNYTAMHGIPMVPVLYRGVVDDLTKLRKRVEQLHTMPSELGGKREGVVIRYAGSFDADSFEQHVCKSVRENHVQTDEHWRRNWKPCALTRETHVGG